MPEPSAELLAVMAAIEQAGHYPDLRELPDRSWGIYSAARRDSRGQLYAPVLWTFLDTSRRWVVGTGLGPDYFHVPDESAVAPVSIDLLRTMDHRIRFPEEVIKRYGLVLLDPSLDEGW